jgi:pyruvate/2-oxoglutarate/acetoin dehydrogenase E1 component
VAIENLPLGKAINLGLRQAMLNDPKVIMMGEDIGTLGGVFRVTEGLKNEFGADRVLDTPLASWVLLSVWPCAAIAPWLKSSSMALFTQPLIRSPASWQS